jgi:hypothetical protein
VAPPATVESGRPEADCLAECLAVLEQIQAPVRTLVAEGTLLAELGQSRSRNLVELTVRMDRFRSAADVFEGVYETLVVPVAVKEELLEISRQVQMSLDAIDSSIAAIRSFDWDALGGHVDSFAESIQTITELSDLLGISESGDSA